MKAETLRKSRNFGRIGVCAGLLMGLWTSPAAADLPLSMTTEGLLHAKGGGPVADGDYTFTFSLYEAAAGGAAVWTESKKLTVKGGEFHHVLGSIKALDAGVFAKAKQVWIGVTIEKEAELARTRLHSVAFSLVAGVAAAADKLLCTGCVSMKQLNADGDLNLGSHALTAAKVTSAEVVAKSFVGDGSKLTGISHVAGTCANKGDVVKGIDKDGKLVCVKAMDPEALPADGLDEISNGQLSAEFNDTDKIAKAVPITDNNPSGASATIDVPDRGVAKKVTVSIEVSNSDFKKLKITLTDPAGGSYVLFNDGGKPVGGVLKATYPTPTKTISGDLNAWIGKNPKGKWTVKVVDATYLDNKIDGEIKAFQIDVLTLSSKKVQAPGDVYVGGKLVGAVQLKVSKTEPIKCDASTTGYMYVDPASKTMNVCNGDAFFPLAIAVFGTEKNPAKSCKHILEVHPASKSGNYWIDSDGIGGVAAFSTVCDMETDGGGWTRFFYRSAPNGTEKMTQKPWDEGMQRAADGGIKQWLTKTYGTPGQNTASGDKFINAWIANMAAKVQGKAFTHFKYQTIGACNQHRYSGDSWIDKTTLVKGSQCTSLSHTDGRQIWGEHLWCGRSDRGWMWMAHCGSPSAHLLIVNHDYNYPPRYETMIAANHPSGKWPTYDEDGGAFEFFYR